MDNNIFKYKCNTATNSEQRLNYSRWSNHLRSQSTICTVIFKNKSGIGAIYGYDSPEGTWRTLFITSFEVLSISDVKEITDLILIFKDGIIKNQNITPDWVKWLWTSPGHQLNVALIELSPIALKILSGTQYTRLIAATPIEKMKITIIDPNGSISNGNILNLNGNCINFTVGEDRIIQGAPILNENFNVVGIYCGLCDASNENPNKTCTAINIFSILDAYNYF